MVTFSAIPVAVYAVSAETAIFSKSEHSFYLLLKLFKGNQAFILGYEAKRNKVHAAGGVLMKRSETRFTPQAGFL